MSHGRKIDEPSSDADRQVAREPTIRADFHTHTCFSHDAHQTPRELVERARQLQLDRVAITDHHTLDGALRARDLDPERIIVGEEITTRCRIDIIGLYLTKRIAPRLPLEQVVDETRAQGGISYLPPPSPYLLAAPAPVTGAFHSWISSRSGTAAPST